MTTIDFYNITLETDEIIAFLRQKMTLRESCHQIIAQRIVAQAADYRNIAVTPEEIQAEANKVRHSKRLEKASDTVAWLQEQMISADEWETSIQKRLLEQKLAKNLFDKKVESYFAQNRLSFERFIIYQIIVPYEQLAQELYYQIEEEEISFYEAAHLYNSNETLRYVCGYGGKTHRLNFAPNVAAILFQDPIPLGVLLGPVKTEEGYHLFKVEEYIPAELTEEVRQEIINLLFKQWLDNEFNYMINFQKKK
ncbi:MAG: hypothetical protein Tsb0014_15450 [Pleurocapsa sp.]